MSNWVEQHIECINDGCTSSDGMSIADNGRDDGQLQATCFVCELNTYMPREEIENKTGHKIGVKKMQEAKATWSSKQDLKTGAIRNRLLKADTIKKFDVRLVVSGSNITHHLYPFFAQDGKKVGNKVRVVDNKDFFSEGITREAKLFGQQSFFPSPKQYCYITEGELDAMSGYQMFRNNGRETAWMSLKNAGDVQGIDDNFHYLSQWKGIVLMMDNDTVGQENVKEIVSKFPAGYCHVFPHQQGEGLKDASDYLVQGKPNDFLQLINKSIEQRPESVVISNDASLKKEVKAFKYEMGLPYPFESWNTKTYGIRPAEFVLIAARRGTGKTTSSYEIVYNLINTNKDVKIGCFFLEETKIRTAMGLMSLAANLPLHRPEVVVTEQQFDEAWSNIMEEGRFMIYDHCDALDLKRIEHYIRYFVKAQGCTHIILDHLGRVRVPEMRNDERRSLDEVGSRLSALCVELNISIIGTIHLNRDGMVRGSDGPENAASVVIHLERGEDEGTGERLTKCSVTKNRLYGFEGDCDPLVMDQTTGRMVEKVGFNQQQDDIEEMKGM